MYVVVCLIRRDPHRHHHHHRDHNALALARHLTLLKWRLSPRSDLPKLGRAVNVLVIVLRIVRIGSLHVVHMCMFRMRYGRLHRRGYDDDAEGADDLLIVAPKLFDKSVW